jgi:hypothetical protein
VKLLSKQKLVEGLPNKSKIKMTFNETCTLGKQHKEPFLVDEVSCVIEVIKLVHSNVWGPTRVTSFNGSRYFITFTHDFSRRTFVSFLQNKLGVFHKILKVERLR